jgi:hypothetical protein
MRSWVVAGLVAVAAPGCGTAAGRFLADRARDLGECVRLEVGGAVGGGVVVEAAGLLHVGLGGGAHPAWGGLGWCYGTPRAFVGLPAAATRGATVVAPVRGLLTRDASDAAPEI